MLSLTLARCARRSGVADGGESESGSAECSPEDADGDVGRVWMDESV